MSTVPNLLANLPAEKQVAGLLYLGWTHDEITTAVDVSKGTVQNYRDRLEAGKLAPPPALFGLVRARERAFHRASRESSLERDAVTEQLATRLAAIVKLGLLDIHPDGALTYEDLVAFATLVAGHYENATAPEVVDRLSDRYDERTAASLSHGDDSDSDSWPSWSDVDFGENPEDVSQASEVPSSSSRMSSAGFELGPSSQKILTESEQCIPTRFDFTKDECLELSDQYQDGTHSCRFENALAKKHRMARVRCTMASQESYTETVIDGMRCLRRSSSFGHRHELDEDDDAHLQFTDSDEM